MQHIQRQKQATYYELQTSDFQIFFLNNFQFFQKILILVNESIFLEKRIFIKIHAKRKKKKIVTRFLKHSNCLQKTGAASYTILQCSKNTRIINFQFYFKHKKFDIPRSELVECTRNVQSSITFLVHIISVLRFIILYAHDCIPVPNAHKIL